MSIKGEVKWFGIVNDVDAFSFMGGVKEVIEKNCENLYVEIQYSPTVKADGTFLYSAAIIGRIPK